jgi:hypothetical protein
MGHQTRFLGSILVLVGATVVGCVTTPPERAEMVSGASYKDIGDRIVRYRQQAAELRRLAASFAWEAEWETRQAGGDSDRARRKLQVAEDTWAAADEADDMARRYREQLPHNLVY